MLTRAGLVVGLAIASVGHAAIAQLAHTQPAAAQAPGPELKKELAELQGVWRLVGFEVDGKEAFLQEHKQLRWVIKDDRVLYGGDELAKLTLDSAANPRCIDLHMVKSKRQLEGIYKLEKDRLKICVALMTDGVKERPLGFKHDGIDKYRTMLFERDKPGTELKGARGFIGVQLRVDDKTNEIQVVDTLKDSPAQKAGLKKDDVIVGVNGTTVSNREQVVEILREYREGQTIKLHVQRAEERFDADVRMMPPSADTNGDAFSPEQRSTRLSGNTSKRAEGFEQAIEHDTVLKPYFCGGPLVNLDGKAIGLNIARASRVSTYALPARLVRRVFEQLKSGLSLPRDN